MIIEITRKPTAVQVRALRTGLTNPEGIISVSADKRTHEGLVGRGLADWKRPETLGLGRSAHGTALCVITQRGRDYLAKLDGTQPQQETQERPAVDNGAALTAESAKRGEWHITAQPSGLRVTMYALPNKRAAQAARDALAAALPHLPWSADADTLKTAAREYRNNNGDTFADAVTRALAAVPAADPHGYCRGSIASMDTARAARAALTAREVAAGYTETVSVKDVKPGDRISFRYVLTKARYGFMGMAPIGRGPGSARTVTVRATVTGEGRVMTRHGNNYDEGVNGLRFPLANGTWLADDGTTGTLLDTAAVTVEWGSVRRAPAAPARKTNRAPRQRQASIPAPPAEEATPQDERRYAECGCRNCQAGRGSCVKAPTGQAWGVRLPGGKVTGVMGSHGEALAYARRASGGTPVMVAPITPAPAPRETPAPTASTQEQRPAADGNPEHYVTVNDGSRAANALGPYLTDEEARANLPRVRAFLNANDPAADTYEYGTFRVRSYGRTLGPGKLNDRIGLHAPQAADGDGITPRADWTEEQMSEALRIVLRHAKGAPGTHFGDTRERSSYIRSRVARVQDTSRLSVELGAIVYLCDHMTTLTRQDRTTLYHVSHALRGEINARRTTATA